jgi:hypothetical protein
VDTPGASAPRLVGLTLGDEPDAWRAVGFHVERARFVAGGVTCHLVGPANGRGVLGWQLEPPAGPLDGLASRHAGTSPSPGGDHPNGVTALDHVVVATDDLDRTTSALATAGITPRRTVVGAQVDADVAFRFFLLGTCALELVGPADRAGGHAAPAGDAGPSGRAAFAGLAFATSRIDELGALAPPPRPAVQPGRRITTLDHRKLGVSVPVALLSPRPPRRN